jgi:hypothetical protein
VLRKVREEEEEGGEVGAKDRGRIIRVFRVVVLGGGDFRGRMILGSSRVLGTVEERRPRMVVDLGEGR